MRRPADKPIMTQAPAHFGNPADQPTRTKFFAFALMCLGFFMATLDIQIVASSLKDTFLSLRPVCSRVSFFRAILSW